MGYEDKDVARWALNLGFYAGTLGKFPQYCGENLLELHMTLAAIADEIDEKRFAILHGLVERLQDLEALSFRTPNDYKRLRRLIPLFISFSDVGDKARKKYPHLYRWHDLATRFYIVAYMAVQKSSRSRMWFDCGIALGDWADFLGVEAARVLSGLQIKVGELPKRLLESNRWLDDFCHFDFEQNSPQEWAATWFPDFNITGYRSLFEHLRSLVTFIDCWPPEGAAPAIELETASANSPPQWRPGYPGLELHDGGMIVRRGGKEAHFRSRLHWAIFRKLEKSQITPIPLRQFTGVWKDVDLAPDPADGTIKDAIADLRGILKGVGVDVKGARGLGYRLELIDDLQAAQPATESQEPAAAKQTSHVPGKPRKASRHPGKSKKR
jgi:hypothetical protein